MSLFFGKTVRPQNGLLIFLWEETHSETKSWKSFRILTKKVTTTTVNPGNRRGFACESNFFIFFLFSSCFFIFRFFFILSFSFFFFDFLSFCIIFLHFPTFSFMFFHFLSCSLMFSHVLSCSLMFSHVPSCSFMFLHFPSFSFIFFVGCSKSDFLGLNFVAISHDSFYVKNQFLGPSRGAPFGPSFVFSYYFFLVFLSFLLLFFIFLFFVHFFIF